ncbi:hypothetical protein ASG25_10760 [Rhizobium sp. Leaf384]|nr:hypothetical protein ASG25_10760 [Rhizobium sp. Leaf384]
MRERMSAAEFRAQPSEKPKRSKYNAQRTLIDGICFDSKAEAAYYAELKIRARAGEVSDVEMQRPYELCVGGHLIATYKADFVFWDHQAKRRRVIDVKGVETTVFKLKRKLMRACHGIVVETAP